MNRLRCQMFFWLVISISFFACQKEQVSILLSDIESERAKFGKAKLSETLITHGYDLMDAKNAEPDIVITIGSLKDSLFYRQINKFNWDTLPSAKEAFLIHRNKNTIFIVGAEESGTLYGCLELIDQIREKEGLPEHISLMDQPEMVMRGTCVGLQKTEFLPGRIVYEYPYTPENFPWFYDKELWIKYLDMLVKNRMNSLYLWNGHPFASLVKLKDYPYALEVNDSIYMLNKEIFGFLTREADKRGIYVIQMFYNIIVSKPFAEHYGIKTQDRSRPILPFISDYTRKSIAAFIQEYPNVGLMVCLGEAMNTIEDDIEWFTGTIIPGVKDGLKAIGRTDEPPIILRGHDTDAKRVMEAALPIYKNLYTTHKYNGESLTTYQPRGSWASIHQGLSRIGSVHISNVHILANLEPFRYGSPNFIRKSVIAMHKIQGANGLHLYPQAAYWDWPYTADNTNPRLLQVDRDWIWYKAWARYAWDYQRDSVAESAYWIWVLGEYYGCGQYGEEIVKAYDEFGEIAPKLLRRFGISDGNRQTLLLGMFMSQLVNPYKWNVFQSFYDSNGPEGEILLTWAEREWNNEPHIGETPPQIIKEVMQHGKAATEAMEKAAPYVRKNKEEFLRLKNDVNCYNLFARYFAEKVKAAMLVLRYKYSTDLNDLEIAIPHLENSVKLYTQLVEKTKDTYLYANSMQTSQRRIPIAGTDGENKTWEELLPHYQEELENFKRNVNALKASDNKSTIKKEIEALKPVEVKILTPNLKRYYIRPGQKIYTDQSFKISAVAPELNQLKGVKFSFEQQRNQGTILDFECRDSVKVVVGYFNGHSFRILPPPTLETNAQANNRGQADIKIANALNIPELYPVNIYTYTYKPGMHTLNLGKGIVLILGFIEGSQIIPIRDAGINSDEKTEGIDWLFY